MEVITRNTVSNKRDLSLIEIFDGRPVVSLKNAKKLCGYSETTKNDVILNKVSICNLIKKCSFSKNGNVIETTYVSYHGFKEILYNMTQKDKIQNVKLALNLIHEATNLLIKIDKTNKETSKVLDDIREIMDKDGFSYSKWSMLFNLFSEKHNISPDVQEQYLKKYNTGRFRFEVLNYVAKKYPDKIMSLLDISKQINK